MRLLGLVLTGILLLAPATAIAERPPVAISGGLGSRHFEGSGTELVAPLQIRLDLSSKWTLRLGEDIICSHPACAVLGFYRAGALFRPFEGPVSPYGYGHLAFFLHGAHPIDNEAREYNVGLHWGAGAGVEIKLVERIGMYVEGGVLGDIGGDFVVPTFAAGVLVRFGGPRPPAPKHVSNMSPDFESGPTSAVRRHHDSPAQPFEIAGR